MKRKRSLRIVALIVAGALGACNGGGGGGGDAGAPTAPPGTPSAPQTAQVTLQSGTDIYGENEVHAFQPTQVEVARNGSVTWVNETGVVHNVTFLTSGAPSGVEDHFTGSNARSFPTAGNFDYRCTHHDGMAGRVVVRP